jgi:hypothetical protein
VVQKTRNEKANIEKFGMCKLSKIRGGYILYDEENVSLNELGPNDMYLWVSRNGRVVLIDSKNRSARRRVYWVYNVDYPNHTVKRYELNYKKWKSKFRSHV